MLFGFSGVMGTGKSLNAIKFIIENDEFAGRPVYYHGIRCLLLDYEVCATFHGWLYGVYWQKNLDNSALNKKLESIDKERRLGTIEDFPYLAYEYKQHDPMSLWLAWFKKLASKTRLQMFYEALEILEITEDQLTYHHIEQMNLSWKQFHDPTLIHELPSGSVALVDEVQNIWPTRQSSKLTPKDVEHVATHRHNGQDLCYISQDFKDVDQFIRRRLQEYRHYEFIGGDDLHEYFHIRAFDPDKASDMAKTEKRKITRDKRYYGVYLSSIKHTQNVKTDPTIASGRRMIVSSLIWILTCLLVLVGGFYHLFFSGDDAQAAESPEPQTAQESASVNNAKLNFEEENDFIMRLAPRVESLPFTAPAYDGLTEEAQHYPKLTCVITNNDCSCFTQQATAYAIDIEICINVARFGYFDPFNSSEKNGRKKQANRNQLSSGGVSQ